MNRQYKATVIFQEIGGTNKVRIVSKKISKETMDKLSSYLFREMIVEEPIRQNLSDLKEQLDLAEQQIKDQIADDEAHDAQ